MQLNNCIRIVETLPGHGSDTSDWPMMASIECKWAIVTDPNLKCACKGLGGSETTPDGVEPALSLAVHTHTICQHVIKNKP